MGQGLTKEQLQQRYDIMVQELNGIRESLKRSQKQLSEYKQIVENANTAIIRMTPEGRIEYINPFAAKLFGTDPDMATGKPIFDVLPENSAATADAVRKILANLPQLKSGHLQYETKITDAGGNIYWIAWANRLLYDHSGNLTGIISTGTDISQRKKIEEALRESEFNLNRAQEIARTGSWVWEPDTDAIHCSGYFFKILGIKPVTSYSKLMKRLNEMIFPEYRQYINKKIELAVQRGTTESYSYQFRHPDGGIRWIEEEVSLLGEIDRKKQIIIGTIRDITEKKKADDKLKEYLLIVSSSSELMSLIDQNYRYVNVNQAYLDAYRKRTEDIEGHTVEELFGKKIFREIIKPNIDRCLLGETISDQYWYDFPGLGKRYMDVKYNPVREMDGSISGVTVSSRDITDRKLTEEALQKSEHNFRSIFTNAAIGIDVVDEKGNFLLVNEAFAKMMGYDAGELTGMNIRDVTFPEDVEQSVGSLKKVFSKKRKCYRTEKRYVRKDGTVFWADLSVSPYFDVATNRILAIGTIIDISRAKMLQEALQHSKEEAERANKAKSEFLASMSHEIRTPLNAVIGFTELLERMLTDSKQKSYLEAIKAGGKSLLVLINDILDLSKIEAGKMEFSYEPVNINNLIDEIRQIFALKVKEKQLDFIIDVDPLIPGHLVLDEVRVRQVVFNLIGNAIKFTEKGFVKLSVKAPGMKKESEKISLLISVEDSGIGIPPDQQQMIFDAFQQQTGQSNRKYGGTGLGLSISKRLIEMMGGEITVKSTVGKGSVFSFRLTDIQVVKPDAAPAPSHDGFVADSIRLLPATILIADDIESNRKLITESLATEKVKVFEAENGEEAVAMAISLKPDLILMDIRMPGTDGVEACKQIKANPQTAEIPVIALTATMKNSTNESYDNRIFDGFLTKPVSRAGLYRELMKFLPFTENNMYKTPQNTSEQSGHTPESLSAEQQQQLNETAGKELFAEWKKAAEYQMSDEIEAFAGHVRQTGTALNIPQLISYGENLLKYVDAFDLEKMDRALKDFPRLTGLSGHK